jgi:hypothetical protein
MGARLITLLMVLGLAACNAAPIPAPVTTPTEPTDEVAISSAPSTALTTESVGQINVTYPADWHLDVSPTVGANQPGPRFYLSDSPLVVGPCPTADPATGVLPGCPLPLAALPASGVIVSFSPNPGVAESLPPPITIEAPDRACASVDGDAQVSSAAAGMVIVACLRGPAIATHEAEVWAVINSLRTGN